VRSEGVARAEQGQGAGGVVIVGLAALPSTAAWSWAGTRFGPRHAYAAACLLEALGVAVGGLWMTPTGALLAAALLGGTFITASPRNLGLQGGEG